MSTPKSSRAALPRLHTACAVLGAFVLVSSRAAGGGDEPLAPLPPVSSLKLDSAKVALGAKLFADVRLSRDGRVACATCHDLSAGGVDGRAESRVFSTGAAGVKQLVNTPTVFNAAFNFRQQWSGGAASIEAIVDSVIVGRADFGSSWPEVIAKVKSDGALAREFDAIYGSAGVDAHTITNALATYVRSLVTPSRFDRFLKGDPKAITADEKRGYERFKAYGCVGCHQGVNVGGNMFQRFGAMRDYFADRAKEGRPARAGDHGRFNVTSLADDDHVFKVPTLRNVALTAPYFHDGSAATLADAVDVMFRYQLGRTAPPEDKALIVQFLTTLTGDELASRR